MSAGLNRQERSITHTVSPKQEQKHRAAQPSTVSSIGVHTRTNNEHQNTKLQINRMAIAPNVDRKHRHHTGHINIRYIVHKYNSIIPLDSKYSPVRSRPAPQSTAGV